VAETFRSAAMVVNAKSRRGQDLFTDACRLMAGLPYPVDAHAVHDPDELQPTLARALEKGPELVILGGGDGTISGLVDQLVGKDVVMGVLPLGTANSFARTLGVPLEVPGAVEVIRTGKRRRIDLGMIDGDYFANCAAIGISPRIAETIPHHLKRYLGRAGYLGWAALQFVRFEPFTLVVDGESIPALEVRISNGPYHGGTELVDSADIASGEIVVQAVVGRAKRRLVANWAKSVLTGRASHDEVREFRGTSLRIETIPPLPISIDGELLAHAPVTASVAAGVIEVLAPADQPGG
jgi:diacylglycerol kinase family enzyme